MNLKNRQARSKRKAKHNRVMRNPRGSDQVEVVKLLKKALRKR